MFPDSPFAVPRSSFERPVPLVFVDPCAEPTVTVRINREWIPYVLGSLKQLVLQSTWRTDDPDELAAVQGRAMMLLSCIGEAFDSAGCACGCKSYIPSAEFIDWTPQNPYTQPDYVPPHYVFPPWTVLGGNIPFTGLQAGDVVTTLLRAPVDTVLAGGFPRFRVHVNGPGTVELTLLRFPTASIALISWDDNPATLMWTDLNVGLDSDLGNQIVTEVVPVTVTGPGDHHIDVTIVPTVGATPPYVNFGGGIRQLALCGFGETPQPSPAIRYVQIEDEPMPICTQLRWNNGVLEGLCCFNSETCEMEWVPICGAEGGLIPSGGVQPGGGSRPAPGQTQCFNVLLNANNQWLLPFGVNTGDVVTISAASGAWSDGTIAWFCPDGTPFFAGACVGSGRHDDGDPDATEYHMQAIAEINGQFFPASNGTWTVPAGASGAQMTIYANDGDRSDNAGSISLRVCVTNGSTPPPGDWCYAFNFAASDYGFTFVDEGAGPEGSYVAGAGLAAANVHVSGFDRVLLTAELEFASTVITGIDLTFNMEKGSFVSGSTPCVAVAVYESGGWSSPINVPQSGIGSADGQTQSWTGTTSACTKIQLFLQASGNSYSGSALATSLILRGTGTNPFGASNC